MIRQFIWEYMSKIPNRHHVILSLSLPIIGGMISQNVLNIVDTAMVGRVGVTALASVGLGSFLHFCCAALVMGLSMGVQTLCARLRGAEDPYFAAPLNGGLTLAFVISLPLTLIVIWGAPSMMSWVTNQPEVAQEGERYLQARLIGLVAVGINFAFRSYWSAVEKTLIYLIVLLVMHASNIFLNWLLIFGNLGMPAMGVEGAGLGTALSVWIGAGAYFGFALLYARPYGFLSHWPTRKQWKQLLTMSIPTGVERLFFAFGMTLFMTMIGWVGERELAASHVILNLFLTAILPALAFGITSATLVAKSMGAQQPHEAIMWRWTVSLWSLGVLCLIGFIFWIYPEEVTLIFTEDQATLGLIKETLVMMAFFLPAEAFHMVVHQSLLGLGDNRFVMCLTLGMQWLIMLPLVYFVGVSCALGLSSIWLVHFTGRVIILMLLTIRWRAYLKKHILSLSQPAT